MFINDDRRPDMPEGIMYHTFTNMVSKMNQNKLILELARRSAAAGLLSNFDPKTQLPNWVPPFAYGDVARASIARGTRDGYEAIESIVDDYLHASIRIYLPNVEDLGEFGVHLNELRTMHIQGADQQTPFSRATSALALFSHTTVPDSPRIKVMRENWFESAMGVNVDEYFFIINSLSVMFRMGEGVLSLKELASPTYEQARRVIGIDKYIHVLSSLSISLEEFREIEAGERAGLEEGLQRLTHNPLRATPFISGITKGYVAPVWQWIGAQVSTSNLYYALLRGAGDDFASDLGLLFEEYVGRHARLLDKRAQPEIEYKVGKRLLKTTDWLIELDDVTMLVECKSTRPDKHVQTADDHMLTFIGERVGKAVKQLNATHRVFSEVAPASMSRDTLHVGIILTMEPFYGVTSTLGALGDINPEVPTAVINVREFEALVTLGASGANEILRRKSEEVDRQESNYFDLSEDLALVPQQDNPLLIEAWEATTLIKTLDL